MSDAYLPERLLIVDDHALVRDGLRSVLQVSFPQCEFYEAADFEEALNQLGELDEVDLVLLDLNIPDTSRLSGLQQLRDDFPSIPVVMVSGSYDRVTVRDALAAGAAGFVPKSLKREAIVDALHLLATVLWIGGMAFINIVLEPSLTLVDPAQRGKIMGMIGKRFSMVAWGSVILLLVTGFLKTPDGLLFDTSEGYGITLFLKHIVVVLMILIGLRISLVLVPRSQREAPQAGQPPSAAFVKTQKQFHLLSRLNFALGIIVLILIAIL